jgi:hypothetical protein
MALRSIATNWTGLEGSLEKREELGAALWLAFSLNFELRYIYCFS